MDQQKDKETGNIPPGVDALPKYTYLGEQLRHSIPSDTQCQLFCGGAKCKYENAIWDKNDMAIEGLFSHWVNDDILAMARPNTPLIEKYDMIKQFQSAKIKSVFNLQHPWEHAFCGPQLDRESGFSYSPTDLMKNEIYFYNFPWDDYGTVSLTRMLDTVKVLEFALTEGKATVHCHAGLGRTGTFIACYLIFAKQYSAVDAIKLVRQRRPRSIQTRAQLECIREFENFLQPLRIVYVESPLYETKQHAASTSSLNGKGHESPIMRASFDGIEALRNSSSSSSLRALVQVEQERVVIHREFTLSGFLRHQSSLLSGEEARRFKFIPRIIHVICSTLVHLAGIETDLLCVVERMRPANIKRTFKTLSFQQDSGISVAMQRMSFAFPLHEHSVDIASPNREMENSSVAVEQKLEESWEDEEDVSATHIAAYLLVSELDVSEVQLVNDYKMKLNQGAQAYKDLEKEANPVVLANLFWSWLDHLKEPVLTSQDLCLILNNKPTTSLLRLDKGTRSLLYYLLHFVSKLLPLPEEIENNLILRLLSSLTYINLFAPFDDGTSDTISTTSNNKDVGSVNTDTSLASALNTSCPEHFSERRSRKDVAQIFASFYQIITQNFPVKTTITPVSDEPASPETTTNASNHP